MSIRDIPSVPDKGEIKLAPFGYTIYWHTNEIGGRTYVSDELGRVVLNTSLVNTATLAAVLAEELKWQRLETWRQRVLDREKEKGR